MNRKKKKKAEFALIREKNPSDCHRLVRLAAGRFAGFLAA